MERARNGWAACVVAMAILAVFAFKGALMIPPGPPAAAAVGQFDTSRAIGRLQRILGDQRPHPVDTAADDAVRERLLVELRAIGLLPQVRDMVDCSGFPKVRSVRCSRVRNVVAVLPGPKRPALLLNAHYDSTPTGPGAADDGLGVATLLELASLMKDRPRSRPIVLLFNESEEYGLNGANAFVEQDPLAKAIGRLINIEARGVDGPGLMFETSTPNAAAISDFAASARRPYANSLSADFATLIPNTTDVVKFRPAGWEMLNFAIIGNETRYHSPGDTVAALNRKSLYHVGSEVLAAAQRLSGAQTATRPGTSVYADIGGGRLFVHLPLAFAGIALGLLLIAAIWLCWKRRAWRALGTLAVTWATSSVAALALAWLTSFARAGDYWRAHPLVPNLAAYATVLAVSGTLVARSASHQDPGQLRLASWVLTLVLGGGASLFLAGASIYFILGPAIALVGIAIIPSHSALGRGLAISGAIIQLVMFAEMLALIEMLLIDGPLAAGAPLAALAALPLLVESGRCLDRRCIWVLPVMAAVLWGAALAIPRSSEERPLTFVVDYVRDDTRGTSQWAVNAKDAPLPNSMRRFGRWRLGELKYNERARWLASAPSLNVPAATVSAARSERTTGGRLLRLRLAMNGSDAVTIRFDKDVAVIALGRSGQLRRVDRSGEAQRSAVGCSGRSCDGMELAVLLGTRKPVEATLISQTYRPPSQAKPLIAAAPRISQPQYAPHGAIRVTGTTL